MQVYLSQTTSQTCPAKNWLHAHYHLSPFDTSQWRMRLCPWVPLASWGNALPREYQGASSEWRCWDLPSSLQYSETPSLFVVDILSAGPGFHYRQKNTNSCHCIIAWFKWSNCFLLIQMQVTITIVALYQAYNRIKCDSTHLVPYQ